MKNLLRHYEGGLIISEHGRDNFVTATGLYWTREAILECVSNAKLVKVEEVRLNGYNPNYSGRAFRGIKSWYAISDQFGWDAVFILGEGRKINESTIVLITVLYCRSEAIRILKDRDEHKKEEAKPKIDPANVKPNTLWMADGINFQCIAYDRRLMFEAHVSEKTLYACTPDGQKRFSNHNKLIEVLESGIKHYKDQDNIVHELRQCLEYKKQI